MGVAELLIGVISFGLVLMFLSFIYRANLWYSVSEMVVVGGTLGYTTAIAMKQVWTQILIPIFHAEYSYIVALILGLMMFTMFFRKAAWWMRLPTAVVLGAGIGLNIRAGIQTDIIAQLVDTIRVVNGPNLLTNISNLVVIVGVACSLLYFFYSTQERGAMATISKIGRYFLMVAFGASFAFGLFGRFSTMINDLKPSISFPYYFLVVVALLLIAYDAIRHKAKKAKSVSA